MAKIRLTRRRVVQTAATAALAAPLCARRPRCRQARGWLLGSLGSRRQRHPDQALSRVGGKGKVEIAIDYITSQGEKLNLTQAAEAQARSGHDILTFLTWAAPSQADNLEPVDDLMAALIKENGKVSESVEYVAKQKDHWIAVPATVGSPTLPPCARIDLFKEHVGLDLTKMYPAGAPPDKELSDNWTWDAFLSAAEKCFKAGYPFGMPLGTTNDSVNWVEVVLRGHGAQLVDQEGNITVNSDATKQVLEWFKRLVPVLPRDVFAWDDASNNKWLISGKGALIMNPPSAWAVAVRDAPQVAEKCWTFPTPKGPKGRFDAAVPFFWGTWSFSRNKSAAKSLLAYLCQRSSGEQTVAVSKGYDIPPFANLHDFKTWEDEGPPKGTIYNYPPRGEVIMSVAYSPAPARIANQIYVQATATKMIARCTQGGQSIAQAIDWATSELEGFSRS